MSSNFAENYLSDALGSLRSYKRLVERALEQVSDKEFFAQIDQGSNSIAIQNQVQQETRWVVDNDILDYASVHL